jgi:hypothetical protein
MINIFRKFGGAQASFEEVIGQLPIQKRLNAHTRNFVNHCEVVKTAHSFSFVEF